MNIVYVTPNFGTGGTEKMVLDLALALPEHGDATAVCSVLYGVLGEELRRRGGKYYPLLDAATSGNIFQKALGFLTRILALRKILKDEGADIVHAQHLSALLLADCATFGLRTRVVYTEHSRPDNLYGRSALLFGGILARRAARCTAVSKEISDSFCSLLGVDRKRAVTVLNGIDLRRYSRGGGKNIREELDIAPGDPVVGCIGNLRHEKNQQQLVEAFDIIVADRPNARLLLAGGGGYREKLEKLITDKGLERNVFLLGSRLDTPDLYAAFDVYALTSVFEGLPLTILEAMAAGCPIVATDVTGIHDVVHDGETGLLVPLHNPEQTAQAILRLLDDRDLACSMVEKGRQFVAEYYSLETMTANYRTLYRQVMADV